MVAPRLVVTGTRWGRPDVWHALDAWAHVFGAPSMLVIGDAPGVDTQAGGWADAYKQHRRPGHEFEVKCERVREPRPTAAAYRERDERMVAWGERGDHLLAFPHPVRSPGTWLTYGLGRRAGLICMVVDQRRAWLRDLRQLHSRHPRWAA